MYVGWTKHLQDAQDKGRFETQVYASKPVLDRLIQLLDDEEKGVDMSEMSISDYDKPNWDYKQAHKNGYRAGLRMIKMMVDLDQQKGIK